MITLLILIGTFILSFWFGLFVCYLGGTDPKEDKKLILVFSFCFALAIVFILGGIIL